APSTPHLDFVSQTLAGLVRAGDIPAGLIHLAAQDMSAEEPGPWTGQHSYAQLKDLGVTHVVIAHSEQRHGNMKKPAEHRIGLFDEAITDKVITALKYGLVPVL